jgi:hypothetical protein
MRHNNILPIRKVIIIGIIIFYKVMQVTAQPDSLISRSQFLFPDFSRSVVKLKTGKIITAMMNYNTITQKMTFSQNGTLSDLNKPEVVDTILIQNKKFIFYKNEFLEVIVNARVSLFIQHKSDLKSSGRPGDMVPHPTLLVRHLFQHYIVRIKAYELKCSREF